MEFRTGVGPCGPRVIPGYEREADSVQRMGSLGAPVKQRGFLLDIHGIPSGYVKIAIENDPFIVDVPIKDGEFP